MQIACERCSTSYVLDDTLIPPQGAPVQCTRCGLVFTAKPPAQAPKASATMMFGEQPAPDAPRGGATAMFGAVSVPGASEPGAPKPSGTMIFGASGTAAPAKSAPAGGGTLIFGGGAGAP